MFLADPKSNASYIIEAQALVLSLHSSFSVTKCISLLSDASHSYVMHLTPTLYILLLGDACTQSLNYG